MFCNFGFGATSQRFAAYLYIEFWMTPDQLGHSWGETTDFQAELEKMISARRRSKAELNEIQSRIGVARQKASEAIAEVRRLLASMYLTHLDGEQG